ncbi:hypothetical protein LCGC14_1488840 [marine sediment metagenome]|uniref:Uncharacterized protein n=1 Tax=marine sediment metagenome TaxID=412755 RepID=A0A0F9LMS1_9ZZZZ
MILFLSNNKFLILFQDYILPYYTPLLIVLSGIGILTIENKLQKLGYSLKEKIGSLMITNISKKLKKKKKVFNIRNLMITTLIFSTIFIQLQQKEIAEDWFNYEFNDKQIDCFLFIKNELPQESKIMISERLWALNYFVYDMGIAEFNLNNITSFEDLEEVINLNNANYILINRNHNNEILSEMMMTTYPYKEIYRNEDYILYEI